MTILQPNDVYSKAHGWVWTDKDSSFKSFVLKMTHAGEYKTSLPAGVYDVFISEGGSMAGGPAFQVGFPNLTIPRVPHPLRRARRWFLRAEQRVGSRSSAFSM
jgi:hypothetical protein